MRTINENMHGGKAEGLLFLKEHGFNVPDFYVLDYEMVDAIVNQEKTIESMMAEGFLGSISDEKDLWAVRSSASLEDGTLQSFAGLFHTELNVLTPNLHQAIEHVINAFINFDKGLYVDDTMRFAVIIQKMVLAEFSGVLFSHNPNDVTDKSIWLNIIPGFGEDLVSGKEEGLLLKYSKGNVSYHNQNERYSGHVFNDSLQAVSMSFSELNDKLAPFEKNLIKGARNIAKLKSQPVDIEFAVANGTIYWLQVRPITTVKAKAEEIIWDNANISENYPNVSLPLSSSFVEYTYAKAYTAMASFLGMSKKQLARNEFLLSNMVGSIYGGLYYNITAWQKLLYQLPFGSKTSHLITGIWNMDKADFEKPKQGFSFFRYVLLLFNVLASFLLFNKHKRNFEKAYAHVFNKYEKHNFKNENRDELINSFKNIDEELTSKWIVPVLNGFFAMLLFTTLKKVFVNARLQASYPNFINDILYAQGDVVSVSIVKSYQHLINSILTDNKLNELFKSKSGNDILPALELDFPAFKKLMDDYILNYGERCGDGELKIETINYKEDPLLFIANLKLNAIGSVRQQNVSNAINYKQVLFKEYKRNPIKKQVLLFLIKHTILRIKDRENYRFYRTKGFHIIRRIFRAMDQYLFKNEWIESKGDSLYLNIDELLDDQNIIHFKTIIKQRKLEYENFELKDRANRYIQTENDFVPQEKQVIVDAKNVIKGIGCSSGRITALVVMIKDHTIDPLDLEGKILVANYFEPGWINLFSQAAGVISEKGSLLCHTAILCREMGIPTIVGAKGVVSALRNGLKVQMDGALGEIKIIEDDE